MARWEEYATGWEMSDTWKGLEALLNYFAYCLGGVGISHKIVKGDLSVAGIKNPPPKK